MGATPSPPLLRCWFARSLYRIGSPLLHYRITRPCRIRPRSYLTAHTALAVSKDGWLTVAKARSDTVDKLVCTDAALASVVAKQAKKGLG